MPAVSDAKGLKRSRNGNWIIRRNLDYPLDVYKTINSLRFEWNSTIPATIQRIVDHFMICTQRRRRNYRTSASTVEDYYLRTENLEVPNNQEFRGLISSLKAPDVKSFDNQIKANMESIT